MAITKAKVVANQLSQKWQLLIVSSGVSIRYIYTEK